MSKDYQTTIYVLIIGLVLLIGSVVTRNAEIKDTRNCLFNAATLADARTCAN